MKYLINMTKNVNIVAVVGEALTLVAPTTAGWWYGNKCISRGKALNIETVKGHTSLTVRAERAASIINITVVTREEWEQSHAGDKLDREIAEIISSMASKVKKKSNKTKALQCSQAYHALCFEASDIYEYVGGDFKPRKTLAFDRLPECANRFLAGVLSDKFPEMLETEHLVHSGGILQNTRLSAISDWPMILLHYNLIDVERDILQELAQKNGTTFNRYAPLDSSSASWKLWSRLLASFIDNKLEGSTVTIAGTSFKFLLQSNAMAKGAKSRIWLVREDLYPKAKAAVDHGIDYAKLEEKSLIKAFFYRALGMTGCANVLPFKVMREIWRHAIVVDNIETDNTRSVLQVFNAGRIERRTVGLHQDEGDGASFARKVFFEMLHEYGLDASKWFCQFRAPYMKGLVAAAPLPETGTVIDVNGVKHEWKDVIWVIPLSVFKGFTGYGSLDTYIATEPAFGFMQPAANARTTNGQFLDTLMLSHEEHQALASIDLNRFNGVTHTMKAFNDGAMLVGLKSLCYEGLTPEAFANMERSTLVKRIQNGVQNWEKGMRKRANTAHYTRPNSRNLYLLPDLGYIVDAYANNGHGIPSLRAKGVNGAKFDEVCCPDLREGLIVLSRNPICFAGEVVVVMNVRRDWGIPGCCHLASNSRLCNLLSGADFDGDQVFASADKSLIDLVYFRQECSKPMCGVELYFNKGKLEGDNGGLNLKAVEVNAPWSAFCEMQNHAFEQAAQCGARACEKSNKLGGTVRRWFLCAFFSAYMQIGVDAGKYGYVLPTEWTDFMNRFIKEKHKLPGWKFSKSIDKETAAAIAVCSVGGAVKSTNKAVADYLKERFALCSIVDNDKKPVDSQVWHVYDPLEIIATTCGNKKISTSVTHFDAEQIAKVVNGCNDFYAYLFGIYGRDAEPAGNAEDPVIHGDEVDYDGGEGSDPELF